MPAPSPVSPRRAPSQERSREKVDRVLDAAAALLSEGGWEGLNTNRIASRAGVSVGLVYRFFPNKEAVVLALGRRSMARLSELVEGLMPRGPFAWTELADRFVDELAAFWASEPGLKSLWLGGAFSRELAELERESDRVTAERIAALLSGLAPALAVPRRRAAARVLVQIAGPLLSLAARSRPEESRLALAETKALIRAYLEELIGAKR